MSKILIVDDNVTNRALLKALLGASGKDYMLTEADSGEAALSLVEQDLPDIILLDIMMPGMDGFEVCEKLKADARYSSVPILFITAMESVEDKVKGFKLGAADYITKPINAEEVKARVGAHLRIREAEKARAETENLQTIKDMIATYNHNMNQPLMTIYTYMEILLVKFNDEEDKTRQKLDKIKKELDTINGILKKIQAIETVKRADYVGESGMIDIGM
jgi:DNA-binding response OmpR family regulator